jgi:hypothetical protein
VYVGFLTVFSFVLYREIFTYNTFGPETPLFYVENDGQPFSQLLRAYTYLSLEWYRPTAFALPYWVLEHFLGWHNLFAWKLAHFWTALAAAYAIYWLVVRCLGGSRMAGLLSATYFMAQPSLYSALMEAAGFDFLHILLTVLCAGFYLLGTRATGLRYRLLTALSWLLFLIAVTCKEMALVTPGFLLVASVLMAAFEPDGGPLWKRARREGLRLLPFFAVLPVYYFLHLAKIPPSMFQGNGPYRASANLAMILANCRKFPLWIVHIYAWSDQTLKIKMYQSTMLNNLAGTGTLLLVIEQWRRMVRTVPPSRLVLWLMLAWTGIYLVLPVYSGGFIWHINLAVVGYSVLFGLGIGGLLDAIGPTAPRRAVAAAFFLSWLLLSREDLKIELYAGSHATGYRINHSLLEHPPVQPAALGMAPLIYIEDRLGMGPWWYGCFGSLFKFTYLRHDLEEVIVPLMPSVSREARIKWLAHENPFFFRYDENYNWHDATADFRAADLQVGALQPGQACGTGLPPGGKWPIRIAAGRGTRTGGAGAVWEADAAYDGGKTYWSDKPVSGTATPELYQSERFNDGPFEYRFCVPNGTYTVRLKFAEIWFDATGKRIFDVAVNGDTALMHFDIAAAARGRDRAIDREFRTTVVNGQIVIQFRPVLSNPKVSAIEITPSA